MHRLRQNKNGLMRTLLTVLSFFVIEQILSQQAQQVYPDNSPSVEDFQTMGVPHYNKIWTFQDYHTTIDILDQIYEADKYSLPRLESEFSGKLFDRMTNFENFDFLKNPEINLGKRIIEFEKMKDIPFRLTVYYIEDSEDFERFGAEVLECFLLESYVYSLGKDLYDELKLQLGDRAENGNFKQGYDALNLTHINGIERLFHVLESDFERYDEFALNSFGNKLYFLVSNISSESIRKQLKLRIRTLDRSQMTATVKEIIQELRQQL